MKEKYPKWIIENGELIIGKVTFHKELAKDENNIKGGGWFHWDHDNEIFYLYGKSHDFGPAKVEDVKAAIESGKVGERNRFHRYRNLTYKFSQGESLANAFLSENEFRVSVELKQAS